MKREPNGLVWFCEMCGWSTPRHPKTQEQEMVCCRCQGKTKKGYINGYDKCVRFQSIPTGGWAIIWCENLVGVVNRRNEVEDRIADILGEVAFQHTEDESRDSYRDVTCG